ncbi:MAG: YihY family inner membrane protein [Nitrosomonadales bacterium]|nr:YihY family inner membrane protein [Nitrosomonadales bacterium]
MRKNWRNFLNFARFIAMRFDQDRCAQVAASLTFTALLSLVPLLTIALAMFSAFPLFDELSNQIKAYLLNNLMPEMSGKLITRYMQQFTESAMRLKTVGIVFLGVTAMLLMLTIDHAFNKIWRVSRPRPLLKRLVIYWAVLTLAPLLIGASLSLTSWLVGLSMGYASQIPVFGVGSLKILPVLFTTLAFAILFRLVPNSYVPHKHALIGAVVAAVMFESMNRMFGYYISHFSTYKLVYGAFASVPIFLMWVYLSWLVTLLGAVIAASLSHWGATAAKTSPSAQLLDALRVLQIMANGLQQGKVNSFPEMSKSLRLGYDALEEVLDKLESADIVRKSDGNAWLLMRDVGHIRTSELMRLFVLNASLPTGKSDDPLQRWFANCVWQLEQNADLTLQELFAYSTEYSMSISRAK